MPCLTLPTTEFLFGGRCLVNQAPTRAFQPGEETLGTTVLTRHRYPYGNRVFILNLLGGVMAGFVLLEILSIESINYFDEYVSASLLLAGAIIILGIPEMSFRKFKDSISVRNLRIPQRKITRHEARRRLYRNTALLLVGLIAPVALSYLVDATLWLISVVSFFTSLVIGRSIFFLRVRIWEKSHGLTLMTYTSASLDSQGTPIYELGIVADQIQPYHELNH